MRPVVRIYLAAFAALLLTASPCWPQKLGEVAACEGVAWMTRAIDRRPMRVEGIVDLVSNCKLRTGSDARLSAAFESATTQYGGFDMLSDTEVDIRGASGHLDVIELSGGGLQMQGPGYVLTPECGARGHGTEYIVSYNSDTHVTVVIGVSGHVEVEPRVGGQTPTLTAQETMSVGPEGIRDGPHRMSDDDFNAVVRKFAFIGGGRAESQVVGHPLLAGQGLREAELAPTMGSRWPWEEWPRWIDPPFVQPPGVVAAPQVGVTF
ncbi:MAG TPA: hypothetical protein VMW56_17235 [Candidatus Margulisiibacteriota bacterium]|nr:hypothetical protein [Candidatus Margulisiibacteriota bacterium]